MKCRHCFHWTEVGEECCECAHLVEHQPNRVEKAIERIRELHHPFNPGSNCDCCVVEDECDVCGEYYPCETIKILDGIK
jgi:hypothetical protein